MALFSFTKGMLPHHLREERPITAAWWRNASLKERENALRFYHRFKAKDARFLASGSYSDVFGDKNPMAKKKKSRRKRNRMPAALRKYWAKIRERKKNTHRKRRRNRKVVIRRIYVGRRRRRNSTRKRQPRFTHKVMKNGRKKPVAYARNVGRAAAVARFLRGLTGGKFFVKPV